MMMIHASQYCDHQQYHISIRYLCTGSCDGSVKIVDLHLINTNEGAGEQILKPQLEYQAHSDCVNSCRYSLEIRRSIEVSANRSCLSNAIV